MSKSLPPPYTWPDELRNLLVDLIGELGKDERFVRPTDEAPFPFNDGGYTIAFEWAYRAYMLGKNEALK